MRSSFEGMEGMEGMQGMIGNAGNAGTNTGGGSGDWFFADRVDLPFVLTEQPEGIAISDQRIDIGEFPERNWSSIWYPGLVLAEFVLIKGWDAFNLLPPWADPTVASPVAHWSSNTVQTGQPKSAKAKVQDELDCLVLNARTERANAMAEIVSQKDEFASYFLNLLNATSSYPATARVLAIAGSIGGFTAMYYKGKYKRPRPTMLCPALMPPFPVPGHASFPSGHSTQAHLMALCLADVLTGKGPATAMATDLPALADRIARNREIAGFHYPSDSDAGVSLAVQTHGLLAGQAATSWYKKAITAAQGEW